LKVKLAELVAWAREKIEIEETEKHTIRSLQKHRFPKNVAKNVARLYLG